MLHIYSYFPPSCSSLLPICLNPTNSSRPRDGNTCSLKSRMCYSSLKTNGLPSDIFAIQFSDVRFEN